MARELNIQHEFKFESSCWFGLMKLMQIEVSLKMSICKHLNIQYPIVWIALALKNLQRHSLHFLFGRHLCFFSPTSPDSLIYVMNSFNEQQIANTSFPRVKKIPEIRRCERLDYEEEVLGLLLPEKINLTWTATDFLKSIFSLKLLSFCRRKIFSFTQLRIIFILFL